MKTTIKKVMLGTIIGLLTSASILASDGPVQISDEKSYDLLLRDVTKKTQITFTDKHNNILFNKTISPGDSFNKTFNLDLLVDGEYFVEIEDETSIKIVSIDVSGKEVNTVVSKSEEFFKPVVNEKERVVTVTHFSPNHSPLYIAIYNKDNQLVHEETIEGKMDLGKKYDFSKSFQGEYRFYLESKGLSYDYLVYID